MTTRMEKKLEVQWKLVFTGFIMIEHRAQVTGIAFWARLHCRYVKVGWHCYILGLPLEPPEQGFRIYTVCSCYTAALQKIVLMALEGR